MVTISKPTVGMGAGFPSMLGTKFYGWASVNGKRIGTVWKKYKGGYYCNEDFDSNRHSRKNRPRQFRGQTLAELKNNIDSRF